MRQLTLRFQAQDTWFFQELRPGNSGWLESQFPPPARVFEGAIRTLLAQACGQVDVLAHNLRMAGPWPCLLEAGRTERLYPWPLHILQEQPNPAQPDAAPLARVALVPEARPSRCDLGLVRLARPPQQATHGKWRAPHQHWLRRTDFTALLQDTQATVQAVVLDEYVIRETRLGIGRDAATRLGQEGRLYQTEQVRLRPELGFAVTLRVTPDKETGNPDQAGEAQLARLQQWLGAGQLVRFGAEGRMAQVDCLQETAAPLDPPLQAGKLAGQNVLLVATGSMDFGGHWLPCEFTREQGAGAAGANLWRGILHGAGDRFNLEIYSAQIGKPIIEGSVQGKRLGHGARALVPPGSVWFGRLVHGELARFARMRLGVGKKLGRGEFALATWNEGEK